MQLQLQDFTTLVRNMAATIQGGAKVALDLTTGSVLRAILEANASVALWLQWLAVQILATTRAATSSGPDLDTWVADFGLARLPGQAAATTVTFFRYTPGIAATIPIGAQIKTGDTSVTFTVIADPTNPAYNSAGYSLPALASQLTVPAQAATPGLSGNVGAGAISLLSTAMPGIDTVTNSAGAAGGMDAESDDALRARFGNFIDSRARATPAAIAFAIQSLQQGLDHVLTENADPSGTFRPGYFTVTVDDGSGYPPSTTLASVAAALEAIRPVGTQLAVQPPTVFPANITLTLTTAGTTQATAQTAVAAAITAYVSSLPIGAALPLSRLAALAYAAHPSVTNVANAGINGAGDLVPPPTGIIRPGTVTVS